MYLSFNTIVEKLCLTAIFEHLVKSVTQLYEDKSSSYIKYLTQADKRLSRQAY